MKALWTALLWCGLWACPADPAVAHAPGFSRSDWQLTAAGAHARIGLAPQELLLLAPSTDLDQDGTLDAKEWQAGTAILQTQLLAGIGVSRARQPCVLVADGAQLTLADPDSAETALAFHCPPSGTVEVDLSALLEQLSIGHQHLLGWTDDGGSAVELLLSTERSRAELAGHPQSEALGAWPAILWLGAEHILGGPDHLAFLLGLLLTQCGWRALLWLLTAFTLAHSLTLALMLAKVVLAPPALVEPLIALSVAVVAAANLRHADRGHPGRGWPWHGRWLLVFAFGLVHGFGFAGAVAGLAPEPARMWPWLLAFNLGIELAQVLVAAGGLMLLWVLARRPVWLRRAALVANSGLLLAGVGWMGTRLLG